MNNIHKYKWKEYFTEVYKIKKCIKSAYPCPNNDRKRNMIGIANILCLAIIAAVFISANAVDYCKIKCNGAVHTMCKYRLSTPAITCQKPHGIGLSQAEKDLVVRKHNELRRKVASGQERRGSPGPQPPAANMAELVRLKLERQIESWDNELEVIAQRWANQCNYGHDECRNVERFHVGQNVARSRAIGRKPSSIENLIQQFYDEVEIFNKRYVSSFQLVAKYGHYTQIVWGDTSKIGCGKIYYKDYHEGKVWDAFYLVCNYGPAGNLLEGKIAEPDGSQTPYSPRARPTTSAYKPPKLISETESKAKGTKVSREAIGADRVISEIAKKGQPYKEIEAVINDNRVIIRMHKEPAKVEHDPPCECVGQSADEESMLDLTKRGDGVAFDMAEGNLEFHRVPRASAIPSTDKICKETGCRTVTLYPQADDDDPSASRARRSRQKRPLEFEENPNIFVLRIRRYSDNSDKKQRIDLEFRAPRPWRSKNKKLREEHLEQFEDNATLEDEELRDEDDLSEEDECKTYLENEK